MSARNGASARRSILTVGPRAKRGAPPVEYQLLLTATLCLLALGAVMVFSASSARSLLTEGGGDGAYYLKRTLVFAAIGLLVMRSASIRGVKIARAITPLLVGVAFLALFAVLVPGVGQNINGATRWIGPGALQFQPSEIAKVALILYGAHMLAARPKRVKNPRELVPYLAMVGFALLLISRQPDLGTSLTLIIAVSCMLMVAGVKARTLAAPAAVMLIGVLGMIAINPYQQERLTGFLHPSADAGGAGFQSIQATIALGSGGVTGRGLGESVQKAFYLPEAHTDMIAAVIGEETGLIGLAVLMGLFGMFAYGGFVAAHRAKDRYSKLLAAGLTSLICGQAVLNLFAVLGLAPLTGVPLPFVSYGGTSLVMTLACAGLLLNVARGRTHVAARSRPQSRSGSATAARSRPRAETAGAGETLRVVDGGNESLRRYAEQARRDRSRRDGGSRGAGAGDRRRAQR